MPKLLRRNAQNRWEAVEDDAPPTWHSEAQFEPGADLILAVDSELSVDVTRAASIAIDFPTFNDGRGMTLAVLVRRTGFEGDLRAVGEVHEELFHYLVRCGFTSILIGDDLDHTIALERLNPHSQYYQGSAIDPQPAFRRGQRA